jgi:metallophosphoesterase superfamily enzyme
MGHNHPQLTFFDSGKKEPHPVWLFCPQLKANARKKYPESDARAQLLVMPSFNPLLGNDIEKIGGLGPVFRNKIFSWGRASVYSLGGIRLGTVREIARP